MSNKLTPGLMDGVVELIFEFPLVLPSLFLVDTASCAEITAMKYNSKKTNTDLIAVYVGTWKNTVTKYARINETCTLIKNKIAFYSH